MFRNLGDQFNLPEYELDDLNLEKFVDEAIKVESGEITTLRVVVLFILRVITQH